MTNGSTRKTLQRRLPTPSTLVVFEAAARLASFTKAALELHVTQAAVSQQIRALENQLGATLFLRRHRGISLTPEGRLLFQSVALGLEQIAGAADQLRQPPPHISVTVAATLAVSSFWLLPRLPGFRETHPNVEVHVVASDSELEQLDTRIDVGIRFGKGHWPGFHATFLSRCEVFPVCSPGFLRSRGIEHVEDLLDQTLLSQDDQRLDWFDWHLWFARQGVAKPPKRPAMRINNYPLLIQATLAGQGVSLGWRLLVDDLLENGELVKALDSSMYSDEGFYLVTPANETPSEDIVKFCDWILGEFGDDRDRGTL